jgi:hypothetical protein
MVRIICLAGAAAAAALVVASVGTGAESASRIIDRTVVCKMTGTGFPDTVRLITASATPRLPATDASPTAAVTNGDETGGPLVGAGVRTGRRCTQTRIRVPLSSKGLRGGPAGEIGNAYKCNVPAKVLIRVRAVFRRPTSFRPDAHASGTAGIFAAPGCARSQ